MTKKIETMGDLMAEHEAELSARAAREIAAEDAAWNALPAEERERITAEREARWAKFDEEVQRAEAEEPDEDDEEEESE